MLKRFWSGQLTIPKVVEICRRYQTEQLILDRSWMAADDWKELLTNYTAACEEKNWVLLIAKRIAQK